MSRNYSPTSECLKADLHDGATGERAIGGKWIEKLRQRKEKAADAAPQQSGPVDEAVQPGAA